MHTTFSFQGKSWKIFVFQEKMHTLLLNQFLWSFLEKGEFRLFSAKRAQTVNPFALKTLAARVRTRFIAVVSPVNATAVPFRVYDQWMRNPAGRKIGSSRARCQTNSKRPLTSGKKIPKRLRVISDVDSFGERRPNSGVQERTDCGSTFHRSILGQNYCASPLYNSVSVSSF